MSDRLFELVAAAGIAETHHRALVAGQRVRRDRLARPWAGVVDSVLEPQCVAGRARGRIALSGVATGRVGAGGGRSNHLLRDGSHMR
jgi:hypothetical protein